jgi:hypothetical protein
MMEIMKKKWTNYYKEGSTMNTRTNLRNVSLLALSLFALPITIQAASVAVAAPAEEAVAAEQTIVLFMLNQTGRPVIVTNPCSTNRTISFKAIPNESCIAPFKVTNETTSITFTLAEEGSKNFSTVTLPLPVAMEGTAYTLCVKLEKHEGLGHFVLSAAPFDKTKDNYWGSLEAKLQHLTREAKLFILDAAFAHAVAWHALSADVYTPEARGARMPAANDAETLSAEEMAAAGIIPSNPDYIYQKPDMVNTLATQIALMELTSTQNVTLGRGEYGATPATIAKTAQNLRVAAGLSHVTPAVVGWLGKYSDEVETDLTVQAPAPTEAPAQPAAQASIPSAAVDAAKPA